MSHVRVGVRQRDGSREEAEQLRTLLDAERRERAQERTSAHEDVSRLTEIVARQEDELQRFAAGNGAPRSRPRGSTDAGLRSAVTELERENAELRAGMKAKVKATKGLGRQLEAMEEQMRVLSDGVARRDREVAALQAQLAEKEEVIQRLRQGGGDDGAEVALLRTQLEERDTELELLRSHRSDGGGDAAVRDARRGEEAANRRARDLEASVAGLEKDRELLQTQRELIATRERQLDDMRRRVSELQRRLSSREEVGDLQERLIREKQGKLANMAALVEELRSQVVALGGQAPDAAQPQSSRKPVGVGSAYTYTGPGCDVKPPGASNRSGSAGGPTRREQPTWGRPSRADPVPRSRSASRSYGADSDTDDGRQSEEVYRRRSASREDSDPMLRTLRGDEPRRSSLRPPSSRTTAPAAPRPSSGATRTWGTSAAPAPQRHGSFSTAPSVKVGRTSDSRRSSAATSDAPARAQVATRARSREAARTAPEPARAGLRR